MMSMLRSKFLLCPLLVVACTFLGFDTRADELSDVQRLYYSGQSAAAMKRVDEFLAANPKDPQMRFLKGVMLTDTKRSADAIVLFQKLSEDYPDLAEPYNNLAALYAAGGDYAKARATLDQALRTNPAYATAHENLGDVYAALAAQSYERALKFEPGNVTVPPKLALMRELYKRPKQGSSDPSADEGASSSTPPQPPPSPSLSLPTPSSPSVPASASAPAAASSSSK
jgi:tetratricopeptide (TPR) repeat protein